MVINFRNHSEEMKEIIFGGLWFISYPFSAFLSIPLHADLTRMQYMYQTHGAAALQIRCGTT